MDNIDLQTLADMPGFGAAKRVLIRQKLWDEYRGMPETEFRVRVEYKIREDITETVSVKARCADEAIEKACERVEENCDYYVDITDTEVIAGHERALR